MMQHTMHELLDLAEEMSKVDASIDSMSEDLLALLMKQIVAEMSSTTPAISVANLAPDDRRAIMAMGEAVHPHCPELATYMTGVDFGLTLAAAFMRLGRFHFKIVEEGDN